MPGIIPLTLTLSLIAFSAPNGAFAHGAIDTCPQGRGPLATGFSPHGDPPLHWDQKTNVKWKTPLPGRGSATPIVWNEQIFIATAIDTGRAADPSMIPKPDPKFDKKTQPPATIHQFVV